MLYNTGFKLIPGVVLGREQRGQSWGLGFKTLKQKPGGGGWGRTGCRAQGRLGGSLPPACLRLIEELLGRNCLGW